MEVFNLIAEVGVPIAGALVMAYFIFLVMKQLMGSLVVQKGRTPEGKPLLSRAKRDITTLICQFLGVGFIAES